jgi:ketosteroid isomerase-like protein
MPEDRDALQAIAGQVSAALDSADLAAFEDLLDPAVTWGAPGDDAPACQSRKQVLAWYRRGRDAGVRASVTEVVVAAGALLVGLRVVGNEEAAERGGVTHRWQVLTVTGGRIVDIRGFDDRRAAAQQAGLPR